MTNLTVKVEGCWMSKSQSLFQKALKSIPGGVNSPVRAFKGVGGTPLFFSKGEGAYLQDVDGNLYIDFVGSWGPLILGHRHPTVIQAVEEALANGLSFGAPTEVEISLAEKIIEAVPSIDQVRMVNSGTEATMTAIRLARAFTERDLIVKFKGCYHGHSDSLLIEAGSGALTLGCPSSPGVPQATANLTLNIDYNCPEQVHEVFAQYGDRIAGVLVEPVAGNMGCIPPEPNFLTLLRQSCDNYGALLILDEVMTGFRVSLGGAQSHYQVQPDLTTLGKIIGGGMPVGAIGGKHAIMQMLAPVGSVYQAGTLSGNPITMHAGLATLNQCMQPGFYQKITQTTERLAQGLKQIATESGIPLVVNHVPGMFSVFFTEQDKVSHYQDVMKSDAESFKKFFHHMLHEGIYLAPSAFEAGFISICHDDALIDRTLEKIERIFKTW